MRMLFKEATLLSANEYEEDMKYIKSLGDDWWLRSFGYNSYYAAYVDKEDIASRYGEHVNYKFNVRPVLILNRKQRKILKYKTEVFIDGKSYTSIGEYLVANFSIGKYPFNEEVKDGNDYYTSYIRTIVDNWFNSNFQNEVEVEIKE